MCIYRYYAAFPSLSDKCDLLAGTSSSSPVDPAWSRVAQTHPKIVEDAKMVAMDSGVNLVDDSTYDGSRSVRGSSRSGFLPNNHRRHRRPRGNDDGRRRKQSQRRGRAGWGSTEHNLWPANMFGLPWLCSGHDDHMRFWSLQPSCGGFSQPAVIIDGDWSLPESYKDRFSDLGSSQWTRPSFEEEIPNPAERSAELLHCSNQDYADAQYAEQASNMPSSHCQKISGTGSDLAVVSDTGSTQLLDGHIPASDSPIDKDIADPVTTASADSQSLNDMNSEQLTVAECLPHNLGNLYDIPFPLLQSGDFGQMPDSDPHPPDISTMADDDDDPLLGCRPFDPALWSILNSARMWCGNSSLSRELHLVPNSSELFDIGLHLFGVDGSSYDWSDVETVLDCSGCFDMSDNFSLLSLQDDNGGNTETSPNNDDDRTRLAGTDFIDRLTYTEILGNKEAWDGSRIAEAMLENDAVVMVLNGESVRQIWQPASCCSTTDNISLPGSGGESAVDSVICRRHSQPCTVADGISAISGLEEAKVDGQCSNRFRDWTDKCHCVRCIWQCEILSEDATQSPSWTTSVVKPECDDHIDEDNGERIVSPLVSSASESSVFWSEFHHDSGNIAKASTWDSQLFSLDCLEPLSLDHTDEPKNGESGAGGKVLKSSAVDNSGELSDDFLAKKTSNRLSFLRCTEDEENCQSLGDGIKYFTFCDNLEYNDSGLDPDNVEDERQQVEEFPCITDAGGMINCSSTEAGEPRKFFNLSTAEVELSKSIFIETDGSGTALTTVELSSGCDACSASYPVSSVLADLLEENNNISSGLSEAAVVVCCDDCEEIVQLLPSLASVSDIIFSDTDDSLDSELAVSDASVFSSPEPCRDELVMSESDPGLGSLTVLESSSDRYFHVDLADDLHSMAQCYVGSFLSPVYTLDGSSLWFRDSHYISANVDALSRLRSDLQPSTGWWPSSSVAHESVCTAMAQCRRLLPSENTAFRDNIPQRLEPLVHLQPVPNFCAPALTNNIVRRSSRGALSPWLWPASEEDPLSVQVVPSSNQFRPIGTPSTTDSEQSELSTTSTAEAVTTTDSLSDFASLVMNDVLAESQDTYQRFVLSREDESECDNAISAAAECRPFRPSFKVRYELEKAAQTGPSPPVSVATDVDLRLGCLVKQVLSQLSGEFPEASSNVDDILCDPGDTANGISCPDERNVGEAAVKMSRKLSVIWNDAIDPGGLGLDSDPPLPSELSAVSCEMSQIWTHSVIETVSPTYTNVHSRQLSDIWSDTTVQLADSAYISDAAELLPSGGVPDVWNEQSRVKGSKLRRMWKSVDSGDALSASDVGIFKPQLIWSSSRPNSVVAETETLQLEHADFVTNRCSRRSSSTEERSDRCSVSPSELDVFWGTTADLNSPTDVDAKDCADENVFCGAGGGGLKNSLLGSDGIWSHSGADVRGVECGEADVNTSWNVDPLYCSGNTASPSVHPDSVLDPLPLWMCTEASLDADVAFAFTHLVSGVVSTTFLLIFSGRFII